jgi:formylglycine-generating enzyme required for sulfatase activity
LEDSAEVKSGPFVELLRQAPGKSPELWKRQAAALRVVERLDKAALRELADVLRQHPDPAIRARFETQREAARRDGAIMSPRGGIELVRIPAGTFLMGSPKGDNGRLDSEEPQHRVTLPEFYMGRYPVTNEQYAAFLKAHPDVKEPAYWGDWQCNQPQQPVVGVDWEEASRYAEWAGLRLPTEAEWEYACRAGTTGAFNDGSECTQPAGQDPALDRLGWYVGNSGGRLQPVGEKAPNAWGLYDMHGNVWEWCADHWHDGYKGTPTDGSAWVRAYAAAGAFRVVRGGCWYVPARLCRCAFRGRVGPDVRWNGVGFRLVLARSS